MHLLHEIIIDSLSSSLFHYTWLPGKVPQETFVGWICLHYSPYLTALTCSTWEL